MTGNVIPQTVEQQYRAPALSGGGAFLDINAATDGLGNDILFFDGVFAHIDTLREDRKYSSCGLKSV